MFRILVLCTHNSARSQMAEAWLRHYAKTLELNAEVFSAGTEKTFVKANAVIAMNEVDIDLSSHSSKTIADLGDLRFDVVLTVCDSANEACPVYPSETKRLHVAFPDPSGGTLDRWRSVRDALDTSCQTLIQNLKEGQEITETSLKPSLSL